MGSTCFMNAVLQTFIHNPPLRGFFLSDKHNKDTCTNDHRNCLACQLDLLYNQVEPLLMLVLFWNQGSFYTLRIFMGNVGIL